MKTRNNQHDDTLQTNSPV